MVAKSSPRGERVNELRRPGVPPAQPIDEADTSAQPTGATPPEQEAQRGQR